MKGCETDMNFDFFMPVKVVSGKGALLKNGELLKSFGKKVLVITGGASAEKSGALGDVKNVLEETGSEYKIYNKIGPNPLIEHCCEAAHIALEMKADYIIGIGGGSPMDAAKAAAVYAAHPDCDPEEIYSLPFAPKRIPLVLVGTTSGTGSEVSGVSVLTNGKTGRKKSIGGVYADVSFACPEYTYTVPYATTVSTCVDALSHAAEGWFSPNISSAVKFFAEKGLPLVFSGLKNLVETGKTPDEEGRDNLYYGSLFAGMVLNSCGTAFPHPMGYVLTEDFAVPHGFACGAFLPYLVERGIKYTPEKADEFFSLISSTPEEFTAVLKKAVDISSVSMTKEQAESYAERWIDSPNFKRVPGGFDEALALELLCRLFVK